MERLTRRNEQGDAELTGILLYSEFGPEEIEHVCKLEEACAILMIAPHAVWFYKIADERARQDVKWGFPQLNTFSEWDGILAEECGECCKELNELNFGRGNPERLFEEAVRVAAVAVSIIEQFQTALVMTERWADVRYAGKDEDK